MNKKIIKTNSAEETKQFAKDFAQTISTPAVVTLTGNLGAGKTTFVQGLALGLGIEKQINSPTFLLIKKYPLMKRNLYHVDLYRLSSEEDTIGTGLLDILQEKESIVVIEWPEKMGSLLPNKRIAIRFDYINENERNIIIENYE